MTNTREVPAVPEAMTAVVATMALTHELNRGTTVAFNRSEPLPDWAVSAHRQNLVTFVYESDPDGATDGDAIWTDANFRFIAPKAGYWL